MFKSIKRKGFYSWRNFSNNKRTIKKPHYWSMIDIPTGKNSYVRFKLKHY